MNQKDQIPEYFTQIIEKMSNDEISLSDLTIFLEKLYQNNGLYTFHSLLNDFFKNCFNKKKIQTLQSTLKILASRSYEWNFDIMKINWLESFELINEYNDDCHFLDWISELTENKKFLSERALAFALIKSIEKKKYKEVLHVIRELVAQGYNNFESRDLIGTFLRYGQIEYAFEFLTILPLDAAGNIYIWEAFIEFCCNSEKYAIVREFSKLHFAKTLPRNANEIENVYTSFLNQLCKSKGVKSTLSGVIDDISGFKLKIKGNVWKQAFLKLLEEKIDQKTFYQKVVLVKYDLDAWAYASLITKLLQMKRKVEVLALLDMVINDPGFKFDLKDMNLSSDDMKQIISAQNLSLKCLIQENDKLSAQKDDKSEYSILDRLSFEELSSVDPNEDYEEF